MSREGHNKKCKVSITFDYSNPFDPFGNVVSTVEMKGHDLKEIIAYSDHRSLADYGLQIDFQLAFYFV